MNLAWYLNRLRKMSLAEVGKRLGEYLRICYSVIKYHDQARWPYSRFAPNEMSLVFHSLPGIPVDNDWKHYSIYNFEFDLTNSLDWHFTGNGNARWPDWHHARINYRPGNPYGDVRINWELNRLQFLPAMAAESEDLAKRILRDWLSKNPYLHGPAYLSSMEVALRWFSIYWALCLFKQPLQPSFLKDLNGLAIASGKYIESRLSTHSSAGNHLIVEAVGLFWLGKALENDSLGKRWIYRSRKILWEEVCKQIHPDGSNQEQCFWYLGFVLDAVLHYLLLEEQEKIHSEVLARTEKMLEFIAGMTLDNGSFPDYGDRDDGFVFRLNGNYAESPFQGLLNVGSLLLNRPELSRDSVEANKRLSFWTGGSAQTSARGAKSSNKQLSTGERSLKTYPNGGMTLMQWGKGKLLFRHAPLGLGDTCGHGHADALSVIFTWGNVPVLIDLGSGQYNGDQTIRNFFRSTIAHNTIEIGGKNQARMLGPFLWDKSYKAKLEKSGELPVFLAKASHDGYAGELSVTHTRRIEWVTADHVEIYDLFSSPDGTPMRGAFHLGVCRSVELKKNIIEADFGDFIFSILLPKEFSINVYRGSTHPFMGWRSTVYGSWEPIHSVIFSGKIQRNYKFRINFKIFEK